MPDARWKRRASQWSGRDTQPADEPRSLEWMLGIPWERCAACTGPSSRQPCGTTDPRGGLQTSLRRSADILPPTAS